MNDNELVHRTLHQQFTMIVDTSYHRYRYRAGCESIIIELKGAILYAIVVTQKQPL
jgi:hypothetical protein